MHNRWRIGLVLLALGVARAAAAWAAAEKDEPKTDPKNGPAAHLAGLIFKAAEVEKEKKISKEKFLDGAKKLFAAWDKDKKGSLDEKALADGINAVLLPPGRGPGGPGGFPGGPDGLPVGPAAIDLALRGIELNDKQRAKVAEVRAAQQKKIQEVFEKLRDGKLEPGEVPAAMEKTRDDMLKDMKNVLTKEQYETFEKAVKQGPGGPGGFPGGPGGPGGFPGPGPGGFPGAPDGIDQALRGIELNDKQRAKVEEIKAAQQKKTQEALDKLRDDMLKDMKNVLTKEQYERFEKAVKEPPRGPGGFPGGPGGRPVMLGPGPFFARTIMAKADADKDGKVTLDEFVKACEAFFKDADKNKDGFLDEKELTDALSGVLPPPGPPPGGPRPGGDR
jgi:Spy/CpxP family protein refolding chaperone